MRIFRPYDRWFRCRVRLGLGVGGNAGFGFHLCCCKHLGLNFGKAVAGPVLMPASNLNVILIFYLFAYFIGCAGSCVNYTA